MTTSEQEQKQQSFIPTRPLGSAYNKDRLPHSAPIIALGCSSFSNFFVKPGQALNDHNDDLSIDGLRRDHPRIQSWIDTIEYAIKVAGITILDTAPWYGHGTSEIVVGWALEKIFADGVATRELLTINTKVGRYEADPTKQFDFTSNATMKSVERSIRRLRCGSYINVLQLHDPEFAPDIEILFTETIPAMMKCQEKGWCRALGITGYPLSVQHQILERSLQIYGKNIWDQSLTYGHYNLHDTSLLRNTINDESNRSISFVDYCTSNEICVIAAAPLSMGLLTKDGPPNWHPSSLELQDACRRAVDICDQHAINISTIAIVFALSNPKIATTIIGMSTIDEVKAAHSVGLRFNSLDKSIQSQDNILKSVLSEKEKLVIDIVCDPINGPFSKVWRDSCYQWDGIQIARDFWASIPGQNVIDWQKRDIIQ